MSNAPIMEWIACYDEKIKTGLPVLIVNFPLDGGKNFCYRSRTSFNAFFFNHKKKRFLDKKGGMRYRSADDWEYKNHANGKYPIWKDVPVQSCGSIYEFFDKIGYDYKKGRYTHDR